MKEIKIIIQARMNSTRLPGKSLMMLAGKPLVRHIIDKCLQTGLEVAVAIPDTPEDKELEKYLREVPGITVYAHKGNENDVAMRYLRCAKSIKAEHIMRVTADCPLLNLPNLQKLIKLYQNGDYNYVSNVLPRRYPRGWDAEIFTKKELEITVYFGTKYEHEHVTPYIQRRAMNLGKIAGLVNPKDESHIRHCVDTIEDFYKLSKELELDQS